MIGAHHVGLAGGGYVLTRDLLKQGWHERLAQAGNPADYGILPEAQLEASRRATLDARPEGGDLWLFAYGSLIWNPAFHFLERRIGLVRGVHRSFCLWTHIGRGTNEEPGLVLGLERGGTCRGVFYRIGAADIEEETALLWRREMITGAYRPAWVEGWSGGERTKVLAFRINTGHPRFTGAIERARKVRALALAEGPLGACRDYLGSTAAGLAELDIEDPYLRGLVADVDAYRATAGLGG
ncbi:MAG: gamma-glutamylcyclotransferase [Geminicoccaceae bacterium]|nr:gamma-glutamylcyclotransferase [Geminicoccaceae bacterium]